MYATIALILNITDYATVITNELHGVKTINQIAKTFTSGDKVRVIAESGMIGNVTEKERAQTIFAIEAPAYLYVACCKYGNTDYINIWTNSHYTFQQPYANYGGNIAFDVCQNETQIWLCYKEGPRVYVESVAQSGDQVHRRRLSVARDVSETTDFDVWTNAVFNIDTTNTMQLKVFGKRGGCLSWNLNGGNWILNINATIPPSITNFAMHDKGLFELIENRWNLLPSR